MTNTVVFNIMKGDNDYMEKCEEKPILRLKRPKRAGGRCEPGGKPNERDHFSGRTIVFPAAKAVRRPLSAKESFFRRSGKRKN